MAHQSGGATAERLPTAGFARRVLCLFYETFLLIAVAFGATLALLLLFHLSDAHAPRAAVQAYLLLVCACYFVPQWRAGQTLPMKTWRIRVVTSAGEPLTTQRALVRYVCSIVTWVLVGTGFLWALIDRDGQFLHDRLAGTRLIAVPR
ncbi:MAG: RDD family protein [Rhodospirillaceae bacterium]